MQSCVITLIGSEKRALTGADVQAALTLVSRHDVFVEKQDWLAPDEACDLHAVDDGTELRGFLSAFAHERGLDVLVQHPENRRKKALFADMESTIIKEEMLEELADFVGLRTKVEDITTRAMNGELDFKAALAERLALLKDLSASIVDDLAKKMTIMEGAKELLGTMRAHGAYCVLVSGGFRVFTSRIAAQLGFHVDYGNILDIQNGKLTGLMVEPVLDKTSKLSILQETVKARGLSAQDAVAVGDGANDVPMLLEAGLGLAYRAKPSVQDRVAHAVRFANLRALLWAQGYRAGEIKNAGLGFRYSCRERQRVQISTHFSL